MNKEIVEMLFDSWCENNGQSEEANKALADIYNYCQDNQIPWNTLENLIIEYAAALQHQAFSEGAQIGFKSAQAD
ncbi:MAG: hypothetical protein LUG12_10605 [Erysipelotrichaceae bacterium]|nr:hypothetical protein [Erysipelotrichaceae bacterium]